MWAPTPNALLLTSWILAFGAAFAGSLHCAFMCGPLRLIVEKGKAYQSGRLLGYLALGFAFGALGMRFPWWIWMPLYIALVGAALFSFSPWKRLQAKILPIARLHPFLLGLSTAIFPCGLLHAWVGVAALAQDPWQGSALLGVLWLGSLPSLEFSPLLLRKVQPYQRKFPKAFTLIFLVLVAAPVLMRSGFLRHSHASHSSEAEHGIQPALPGSNAGPSKAEPSSTHSCH